MKKLFQRISTFFLAFALVVQVANPVLLLAETIEEKEARLRAALAQKEREIAVQQAILENEQRETASIERDLAILNARIKEQELKIEARNIEIQILGRDINLKNETIGELNNKIGRSKESLSQLIRKKNEIDQFSLVEIVLSNEDISDFFADVDSFDSINVAMQASFEEIRDTKSQAELEKDQLAVKQAEEADAKKVIESEKKKVERDESAKEELLAINKEQERTYAAVLAARQQEAAAIRAALFALRDAGPIQFGQALEYANAAFRMTGVRPAFLLAILTQESELGRNVGTCNRPGDPPEKHWTEIMPGPHSNSWRDDQSAFLRIMKGLGREPEGTPLSCPIGAGWGGAMGPSQFIPATWEAYIPKLEQILGVHPDPWNPQHAFTASAIYLADLGASQGGYSAEHEAAARYYAGGGWQTRGQAYANSVLNHAQNIQTNMIDPLQGL